MKQRTGSVADEVSGDCLLVTLELLSSKVTALVVGALSRCWRSVGVGSVAGDSRSADPSCAGRSVCGSTERLGRLAEERHGVRMCVCGPFVQMLLKREDSRTANEKVV